MLQMFFLKYDVYVLYRIFRFLTSNSDSAHRNLTGTNFEVILRFFKFRYFFSAGFQKVNPQHVGYPAFLVLPPEGLKSSGRLVGRMSTNVHEHPG